MGVNTYHLYYVSFRPNFSIIEKCLLYMRIHVHKFANDKLLSKFKREKAKRQSINPKIDSRILLIAYNCIVLHFSLHYIK